MVATVTKPKTPQVQLAAIYAMTATEDPTLRGMWLPGLTASFTDFFRNAEEVWEYIMTKSRTQNLPSFFRGLQANHGARHFLAQKFKENFDTVTSHRISRCSLLTKHLAVASKPPFWDIRIQESSSCNESVAPCDNKY